MRGALLLHSGSSIPPTPAIPQAYRDNRTSNAGAVLGSIISAGGRAIAMDADLSDPATPAMLFDLAEQQLGPVDILVNNATGWLADSFAAARGRPARPFARAGDRGRLDQAVLG